MTDTRSTRAAPLVVSHVRESPFAPAEHDLSALPPQHTYGAASMQTYADGQVAYNTHASADGFLAYVNQFEQTSFRVEDGQVEWWQYSPTYDDWQSNYGCDSVEVFYHAGHGGTDGSTGNYSAPLGSSWGGEIFLNSSQMSIGDQRLRYLFLATCEGCMVFAPNNPIRTWNVCNRGMRMLFGATANIYDNPDYGNNFWRHWNGGDSFSQAWQDSLLDAGSDQQPSSMACGASASEAQGRLFNERYFTSVAANLAWYWWRWVGNAPAAPAAAPAKVPAQVKFARVVPRPLSRASVLAAMKRLGFDAPTTLPEGPVEGLRVTAGSARFAVLPGGFTVEHAPATPTRSTLTDAQAIHAAKAALTDAALHLVAVHPAMHAGGPADASSAPEPEVFEHIVTFRQEVAGLPVLTPGVGEVRVHVAASGKVRRIVDTRLEIGDLRDSGPFAVELPAPHGGTVRAKQLTTMEQVLAALHEAAARPGEGKSGASRRLVPGSVAFGYALRGTDLVPVARAKVEFGKGSYTMFDAVEVDLVVGG